MTHPRSSTDAPQSIFTETAADLLEAEALLYSGDNPVYSGANVANILATQATRIRMNGDAREPQEHPTPPQPLTGNKQ